jgi:hypothetical protein
VQILSGVLWIAAAGMLAAWLSARHRADALTGPPVEVAAVVEKSDGAASDVSLEESAEPIREIARRQGWSTTSPRPRIYVPRPPLHVAVTIPLEPAAMPPPLPLASP